MIELALAFNDRDGSYAEHAAAVLTSVFRNTGSQINVHILHDETLTEENKLRLVQLSSSFNHTINFYPVTLPPEISEALAGTISMNRWTSGSMYRLLIPSLIPTDKVIYLDCDVIVNMDISELWATDLGGCYLGAIHDQGIMGVAHIVAAFGLNPESYFNSGVILFGLNNIRQKLNWYEEMVNFLRSHPDTTMPDQDVLNHVFGRNFLPLDQRFNSFHINGLEPDFHQKIVHFAGDIKCWDPLSPGFGLYQDHLNLTPWRIPSEQLAQLVQTLEPMRHVEHAGHIDHAGAEHPGPAQSFDPLDPAQPMPALRPAQKTRSVRSVRRRISRRKVRARGRYLLLKRKNRKISLSKSGGIGIRQSRRLKVKQRRKENPASLNKTTSGTRMKSKKTVVLQSTKKHIPLKSGSRLNRRSNIPLPLLNIRKTSIDVLSKKTDRI
ncbi:glycosyltransferase family 8 protein [Paenibacillus azoreducens]|uniref:glycosyltransferase family 8 protein n=1 Tax=Paenibacillus azoreducens TaxID=116718 RepID=UPI0039F47EDE